MESSCQRLANHYTQATVFSHLSSQALCISSRTEGGAKRLLEKAIAENDRYFTALLASATATQPSRLCPYRGYVIINDKCEPTVQQVKTK